MSRIVLIFAATYSLLLAGCQGDAKKTQVTSGTQTELGESPSPREGSNAPITRSKGAADANLSFEALLAATPLSAEEKQKARAIVGNPAHASDSDPIKARIDELKAALGDKVMPALAHLLIDNHLGSTAVYIMLAMDRDKAGPYIFASMPKSDRNVQRTGFRLYKLWMVNGEEICCEEQMHAAAIRSLEAGTNADAGELALYALGLTGNSDDIPLLRVQYDAGHSVPVWKRKLQLAAEAAMARLGDEAAIKHLQAELRKPVPKSITSEESQALSEVISQVGFSKEMRLMPDVCRHLADPSPTDFTDAIPMFPSTTAARVLNQLHGESPSGDRLKNIARWKSRCATK